MRSVIVGLIVLAAGCAPSPVAAPRPKKVEAPVRRDVVSCTDPTDPWPVLLTNGRIGVWLGRFGACSPKTTWLLDGYSLPGPEHPPRPFEPVLTAELGPLQDVAAGSYSQELDLRTGVSTTKWTAKSGAKVTVGTVLHPALNILAYRLVVDAPEGAQQQVRILSLPAPEAGSTAEHVVCSLGGDGPKVEVRVETDDPDRTDLRFDAGGVVVKGDFHELQVLVAIDTAAEGHSFETVSKAASSANSTVSGFDVEIDGPAEDEQAVRSMVHSLRTGVNPSGGTGPFGQADARYNRNVFWDSDTWILPALALIDPARAAAIPRFRLAGRRAAERNAHDWARAKGEQFHPARTPYKFPWEASPTGEESAPGDSVNQTHITADVALSARLSGAFGLIGKAEADDLVQGCAQFLWHRADRADDGSWGVLHTMSPNELAKDVNDDLYTNIATEQTLVAGYPDRWKPGSFRRPRQNGTFLTYPTDTKVGFKQAAALLAVWPLQDAACEKEGLQMLSSFAGRTSPNGPAMSKSIDALVGFRFGDPNAAYADWRRSWDTYTKRPWRMFGEAPNNQRAYFLTGAAGCLDAFLYGAAGFRVDERDPGDKPWKMPLRNGWWLSVQPNLPDAWRSVKIKNVLILGKKHTFTLTQGGVVVKVQP